MSQDLMNISAFKGLKPSAAFAELDPNAESLADGIGSSYGIVGYKGKVWTLRLRGETYMFTRPDDGSPAAYLDVIVLRSPTYKSKSFYPPGTFQDGAVGTRPTCAALNGETPDADIVTPQSTSCAICPRNVFKTSQDGRKSKECSDYKRLAVLILPSQSKALLGAPLMEPVFLRVPAASLNELAMLGEGMQAQGFHFSSYVTRIGFNPDKPHPQMTFRAIAALGDKEGPFVLPLRKDPTAFRITGESELAPAPARIAAPAVVQQIAAPVAPVAPVVAAVQQAIQQAAPKPVVQPQPQALDMGFGDDTAAVTAAATPAPVAPVAPVAAPTLAPSLDMGFGDTTAATVVQQVTQPVNTVADTGAPEETDSDLDSRIAASLNALMPK
jgi:hypothetical protein